ncbi:glutaminyl-tRNA synthetase [Ruminiclostridium sufflavum DSM 19573]|uniref:Glutamine--tRNA ligase n=1 Tax=Ruminiclostridium sufflavum DSM 19573 TaxID=1121337 RepID=A0A318XT98_9FIRM|nr:glutamine--tRNA ligase/YqeY domain fusion protein [Ruminiclostridium sufflavum]PYG89709.1 glutaminyl-tRNA synthetase [Ruminiclostridium sufflavum DSM 19573]
MADEIKNAIKDNEEFTPSNFIYDFIDEDLAAGKVPNNVIYTRFPPEPNGYLHIGHAKAICIDFGTALKYGGKCNLRFDDTNPSKEDVEYVESIQEDVKWLGFNWDNIFYASDYFETMYECAVKLIKKGLAFVCDLTAEEMREYRGTLTSSGKNSPYRNRTVEENLNIFEKMKSGEFADGSKVLRAKIDMSSPNINMRDPVIYRIARANHHRTADKWCIYPMYDYAHPIEDVVEGITHSLCSLEFEDHRPLYDWVKENIDLPAKPRQIEFARLNLAYTQMSKRKLLQLVKENYVSGWDDPRMPTISGLRRRGYTPSSIRTFCEKIGVAKNTSMVDYALLEHCIREDLNANASRVMAVLNPLKVVIDNYPEGQVEWFDIENNPENPDMGTRKIPFSKEIYIEQEDFMEDPPKKFFRLSPGTEVRLKNTYFIKCERVIKDEATGRIIELRCTYDPDSKGGNSPDGRKVKGTLHWVSAAHAVKAEIRVYDHLFTKTDPEDVEEGKDFRSNINPDSLQILENCMVEPDLVSAKPGNRFQFLRMGYYCADTESSKDKLIFNRTVSLKDTWAKVAVKANL